MFLCIAVCSFIMTSCMTRLAGRDYEKRDKEEADGSALSDSMSKTREDTYGGDDLFFESPDEEGMIVAERDESSGKLKDSGKGSTPSSSGLRAGFADDNKQFNYFISFLDEHKYVEHFVMNVSERVILRVSDTAGKSIPNARVDIQGKGNLLCSGKTYADGTFLFFPSEYGDVSSFDASITFLQQTKTVRIERDGKRTVDVVFSSPRPEMKNIELDILFILDTTGSMGEEIQRLKTTIEIINMNLVALSSKPRVRFGMVLYKDRGDEEYITRNIPFTSDIEVFRGELLKVSAYGGNDIREDLQAALDDAIHKMEWNEGGIRLGFIVTDAPPHLDYGQQYTYVDAARDAKADGIKIFSVGTGGLSIDGEYILRQISQYTYAKYIFLTYGEEGESEGGAPGSVSHHTGANYQTDKLETIIIRFAKEELSYLTDQPLEEGEEYFEAVKIKDEEKEETLKKLFDMAISQLIDYASINIKQGTTAAVIPVIPVEGKDALNAEYFTDQLIVSLAANDVFKQVERKEIQSILDEMELQLSGLVNDESAVRVGALLGAEMLITGKMYRKDKTIEIFFKLLRVETAEVLSVTKTKIDAKLGLKE
ncbi:MAG: VWA domain-containing protein [Spirochaetales bacterium]|nr:VWA domain-containing protein [Spirochaetales bacterium]